MACLALRPHLASCAPNGDNGDADSPGQGSTAQAPLPVRPRRPHSPRVRAKVGPARMRRARNYAKKRIRRGGKGDQSKPAHGKRLTSHVDNMTARIRPTDPTRGRLRTRTSLRPTTRRAAPHRAPPTLSSHASPSRHVTSRHVTHAAISVARIGWVRGSEIARRLAAVPLCARCWTPDARRQMLGVPSRRIRLRACVRAGTRHRSGRDGGGGVLTAAAWALMSASAAPAQKRGKGDRMAPCGWRTGWIAVALASTHATRDYARRHVRVSV